MTQQSSPVGFIAPRQSPRDALAVFHQAADALQLDGKQHKIIQESLRVMGELVTASEEKDTASPPAQ